MRLQSLSQILPGNMMTRLPRITIVTPSYNQGRFLEETIRSVLNQNYPNLEYFIIDGGSTDNSVEIIKKYGKYLTYWVSEPDKGQSDALNKGFELATGDYLTWVNSDDILLPGALNAISREIITNPNIRWITGNLVFIDANDRIIRCSRLPHYNRLLAKLGILPVGGPSTFFARSLYQSVGGFRNELIYNMDYDLWFRFHKKGVKYHRIPEYLMAFRSHESSKTLSSFSNKNLMKNNQKNPFLSLMNIKYSSIKQKKERELLTKRYRNKTLLPLGGLLHCFRQVLNGNYLKARYDLIRMHRRRWQEVFCVDPHSGQQRILI